MSEEGIAQSSNTEESIEDTRTKLGREAIRAGSKVLENPGNAETARRAADNLRSVADALEKSASAEPSESHTFKSRVPEKDQGM